MNTFLGVRIKDDLFVVSRIRKNKVKNAGLGKQRERGEQTRTFVYFSRGGRRGREGMQGDIRTWSCHQLWPHCFYRAKIMVVTDLGQASSSSRVHGFAEKSIASMSSI